MAEAATIYVNLTNSNSNRVQNISVSNWNGQVSILSRDSLKDASKLEKPGLYILLNDAQSKIYVGESDQVYLRLKEQDRTKDYWNKVIILTSSDYWLTKTHVQYLESELLAQIKTVKRYKNIMNTNVPKPPFRYADKNATDAFLNRFKFVLSILGYDFFQPYSTNETVEVQPNIEIAKSPLFIMTSNEVNATAKVIGSDFVVFKDSTVRKQETNSLADTYRDQRADLVKNGALAESDDPAFWVFQDDYYFSSPSNAATVLSGASRNGYTTWKMKDTGQTYGDWLKLQK